MATRARLVAWSITPVVMLDDDENLTPLDVRPLQVAPKDLRQWIESGPETVMAQIQEQVQAQLAQSNGAAVGASAEERA